VEIPDKRTFSFSLLFLASCDFCLLICFLLFFLWSLSHNDLCVSTRLKHHFLLLLCTLFLMVTVEIPNYRSPFFSFVLFLFILFMFLASCALFLLILFLLFFLRSFSQNDFLCVSTRRSAQFPPRLRVFQ
jgi:hypothetical protein